MAEYRKVVAEAPCRFWFALSGPLAMRPWKPSQELRRSKKPFENHDGHHPSGHDRYRSRQIDKGESEHRVPAYHSLDKTRSILLSND